MVESDCSECRDDPPRVLLAPEDCVFEFRRF